ncbi:aminoglycoside phosphotransferase family protein [Paenibacillus rhizolycopersici]|uniref:aminoglycoside phosphotransferase family protein n=1 Tax=Paenibacillus rhizolycopersici TaxID=2780073 RepID=UPI003D2AF616
MPEANKVIAYGRTAEILQYGNGQVLKLFRIGIPMNTVQEEFRISSMVYHQGIPSPQPIQMINLNDRAGIIYQECLGTTLLNMISKKPWLVFRASKKMAKIHLDIHKVSIELPSQKESLKSRIHEAPILTREEKHQIIDYIDRLKGENKLCHGDFHPDNIILGEAEWIIDWMTGMSGHPAGDAARTLLLFKFGTLPEEAPKFVVFLISLLRRLMLRTYIRTYIKNSTISLNEIEQWILPVAAARLCESIPQKEKDELVKLIRSQLLVS